MTSRERWLAATWPLVRSHLPASPALVVDVGCGDLGGFVPLLVDNGYDAIGVDPKAPDGPHYLQTAFEQAELPRRADAIVASTSLHHVASPAAVVDRMVAALAPGGTIVVVEWAWELFDAETAAWCFDRLGADGWLVRRRDEWLASGADWTTYFTDWAAREGLHRGADIVDALDERLERVHLIRGPYFFAGLGETSEAEEQRAIDAGEIRAARIDYVGTPR